MSKNIQKEIKKSTRYPNILLNLSLRKINNIPLEVFNVLNIEQLNLSKNELTKIPVDIEKMINLTHLYLSNNNLSFLPEELFNLVKLKHLDINNNDLIDISTKIGNLIKLEYLHLEYNKLIALPDEIENLRGLILLYVHNNKLIFLSDTIGNLTELKQLYINDNELNSIPSSLGNLTKLTHLDISNNQIITIPNSIRNCKELNIFYINNNPIEYISESIVRILNNQKIYSDKQNVHNHNIQEGVKNGIEYILSIKSSLTFDTLKEEIVNNNILTTESKSLLFEYIENKEVHSVLNITFEELLLNTYSIILLNEYRDEIFRILDQEIKESRCKCFTGRLSRLVNCLNGFDENININISNNEQICNIIILAKNKFSDLEQIKIEVRKELLDRKYPINIINNWIDYID